MSQEYADALARALPYLGPTVDASADGVVFYADTDGRHVHYLHQCLINPEHPVLGTLPISSDGWTTQSTKPLTVTPSVQCMACGLHGFITNGKWVKV